MHVVGVIDIRNGQAVHARSGQRDLYRPVPTAAGYRVDGDAVALAHVYLDRLGLGEVYVADLEAIQGGPPQGALVRELTALGAPVWLDAGVRSLSDARGAVGLGAHRVVVGLETMTSFDALRTICESLDGAKVAFSLDLRNGAPVCAHGTETMPDDSPEAHAAHAADAGAGSVIVLDLAKVGTGMGLDLELLKRVRQVTPGLTLLAGGGIRGPADLDRLEAAGCDGALVATALHEGRFRPTGPT